MRKVLARLVVLVMVPTLPVPAAHALDVMGFAGGSWSLPVRSIQEAKSAGTIRQQYDFSCGAAAVATLLTYHYADRVGEQDVFVEMYRRGDQALIQREGFSLLDMKVYLEARGYRADGVEATLDELAKVGIPAIVLIQENGYSHFVVIKGIRGDRILVGDPAIGTRAFRRPDFEEVWTNGIFFLVRDKQAIARAGFNDRQTWAAHPTIPLGEAISREALATIHLLRHPAGDF
jgi:predicted double-glycine peptidase